MLILRLNPNIILSKLLDKFINLFQICSYLVLFLFIILELVINKTATFVFIYKYVQHFFLHIFKKSVLMVYLYV